MRNGGIIVRKFLKSKAGFTISELAIVILVLGILAAVAVPTYNIVLDKKREDECFNNRKTFQNAMLSYKTGLMFESGPQPVPEVVILPGEDESDAGIIQSVEYKNLPEGTVIPEKHKLTTQNFASWFVYIPTCSEGGTITVAANSTDCWPTCSVHEDD